MFRFAIIAFLTLAAAVTAPAQPLADRIPGDAIVYVGWAGADTLGPGYDASHLKAMVDASEARRVIDEVIPAIIDRIAEKEPDAREAAALARDMVAPMWRHATALYVGPVDMAEGRPPTPRIAVLCAAGKDSAALERRWNELVEKAGQNAPVPMSVRSSDGVVVLLIGKVSDMETLDGKGNDNALSESKNFAVAMSGQKSPVLAAYVDAEAVVKLVDDAVAKGNDEEAKKNWPGVRDTLGLRGLKRLSFTQGFDGKDWGTHAFIEAPAPRSGLLAGLDAQPISDAALRVIPASATVAGVGRLDLARLFDGLRDAVNKLDPNGGREMEDGIGQLNEMLGMDVRQDLLGSLGDEWAYYIAPEVTGRGPLGVVVVNRLKDANKAQAASDKLKEVANTVIAGQADPDVQIQFKQAKMSGVTVHYLAIPFVTPSWVIQDGNVYAGLYPQLVAEAAGHVSKKGKSILDNPRFVAMRKRLGGEKAVSLQFYDLPTSAPTNYQVWLLVSSLGKFGDVLGVDTPIGLLPPLGTLMQHLSPAGSVSWVDDRGWHLRGVSPFPGSTVLASDTGGFMDVQTNALLISIMLPSLNRAREQANRIKSASNLRQIGQACLIYANDHKGKFPDDLAGTMEDLTPEVYVNPRTSTSVPRGLEGDALKKWVNESSDYAYLGKGLTFQAGAEVVVAHEKPERLRDGINILFADSHVEFMPMPQAMEVIQKARKRPAGKQADPDGL